MKFDEITHKVHITSLNQLEKEAYIDFLKDERKRHYNENLRCITASAVYGELGREYHKAMQQFYDSGKIRHEEDIAEIDKLLRELI